MAASIILIILSLALHVSPFLSYRFPITVIGSKSRQSSSRVSLQIKNKKLHDYTDTFGKWYDTIKSVMNKTETFIPIEISEDFRTAEGQLGGNSHIKFASEAFKSENLDYIRMVTFSGSGYNVLNFVATPNLDYDLPIFAVDIVVLPGTSFCLMFASIFIILGNILLVIAKIRWSVGCYRFSTIRYIKRVSKRSILFTLYCTIQEMADCFASRWRFTRWSGMSLKNH